MSVYEDMKKSSTSQNDSKIDCVASFFMSYQTKNGVVLKILLHQFSGCDERKETRHSSKFRNSMNNDYFHLVAEKRFGRGTINLNMNSRNMNGFQLN